MMLLVMSAHKHEQLIFENLERCKRLVGLKFSITFWNKKLNKEIVKDFISRNKDRLFNLGIEITKKPGSVWFLIKSPLPSIEDSNILRKEFPMVTPNPRSNGPALSFP